MTTSTDTVDFTLFAQATKLPDGTSSRNITAYGEPTAVPELFITPVRNWDGRYRGQFALTHVHTGRAVRTGEPYMLHAIAQGCVGLDWSFADIDGISDAMREAVSRAIRAASATEPTAAEEPTCAPWGKTGEGLARTALGLAAQQLATFQESWDRTIGSGPDRVPSRLPDPDKPGEMIPNPEWAHLVEREVNSYGIAYLLLALYRINPELADSAAASLADAWDAGDSLGEWAHQWREEIVARKPATLPGLPDADTEGDLATGAVR